MLSHLSWYILSFPWRPGLRHLFRYYTCAITGLLRVPTDHVQRNVGSALKSSQNYTLNLCSAHLFSASAQRWHLGPNKNGCPLHTFGCLDWESTGRLCREVMLAVVTNINVYCSCFVKKVMICTIHINI